MTSYIRKHLPLITARIEFETALPRPLPTITARMDFDHLQIRRPTDDQPSQPTTSSGDVERMLARKDDPRTPTKKADTGAVGTGRASSASGGNRVAPAQAPDLVQPQTKIPKPSGEPGRPGSNGYSLEATMLNAHDWSKSSWDKVNVLVKKEAPRNLDITRSYKSQKEAKIVKICKKITEEMACLELSNFENCWPIRDMLKLHLKYKSEASRKQQAQKEGKRLRAALQHSSETDEYESEETD